MIKRSSSRPVPRSKYVPKDQRTSPRAPSLWTSITSDECKKVPTSRSPSSSSVTRYPRPTSADQIDLRQSDHSSRHSVVPKSSGQAQRPADTLQPKSHKRSRHTDRAGHHLLSHTADGQSKLNQINIVTRRADSQNQGQLDQLDSDDTKLIGTSDYLESDPFLFTPQPILGPNNSRQPATWLLPTLRAIAAAPVRVPTKPNVMFDMTPQARLFNHQQLREHSFDIAQLIASNKGSTLDPGSEFRPFDQL